MLVPGRGLHLTYCTNVHPSRGLAEVTASLERYAVPLKDCLCPDAPFGIGLRLSGQESAELLRGDALERFASFLVERGLYVFTINGFPHGAFHGTPVKAEVHAPDWRSEERVQYTGRLAQILARLLPEGQDGGISTSPLSYRGWADRDDPATWSLLTRQVMRVVETLVRVRGTYGKLIHLDIEPEPDGTLERSGELASFFEERLLGEGARWLAERLGVSEAVARDHVAEHVQVCFDTCHVAIAFERSAEALETYRRVGLRVGKVQISSALKVALPPDPRQRQEIGRALRAFEESTYLHQVIQRDEDGRLSQYPDLPQALAALENPQAREWRVHFHVPIFAEGFGPLASTQGSILDTFAALREGPFTRHLEIETYTWDVLPGGLKRPLLDSIEREYRWVQDVL